MEFLTDKMSELDQKLRRGVKGFADHLRVGVNALEEEGVIPGVEIFEGLVPLLETFHVLCDLVRERAGELELSPVAQIGSVHELHDAMEKWSHECKKKNDKQLEKTLIALNEAVRLVHRDEKDYKALVEVKKKVNEIQQEILGAVQLQVGLDKILKSAQPILDLVRFVQDEESLDDEPWRRLKESIDKHFGTEMSFAVSRRKLYFLPEEEVVEEFGDVVVDDEDDDEEYIPPVEIWDEDFYVDDEPVVVWEGHFINLEWSEDDVVAASDSEVFEPGNSRDSAFVLLEVNDKREHERVRDLVWHLLNDGKPGLAYCFSRYLEECGEGVLPAWCIRALRLGPCVRFDSGEIAQQLKSDFENFSESVFGEAMYNHGVRFLLCAAALRPALIAPVSNASQILKSLYLKEGLSELYQLCSDVAEYGEWYQPLDVTVLKHVKNQAAWEEERKQLLERVDQWYDAAIKMKYSYTPAVRVWKTWLNPGGIIHELLAAVWEKQMDNLEALEETIDALSDPEKLKEVIEETDRKVLKRISRESIRTHVLNQMAQRVRDVFGFVREWIDLAKSHPGIEKVYDQNRINELRIKINACKEKVLAELKVFEKDKNNLFVSVGVKYCEEALLNLFDLFDPEKPLVSGEGRKEHLLFAELLKVPGVYLDSKWEPGIEWNVLEQVVRYLAGGYVEWKDAFAQKLQDKDLEGAGRILEIWQDEQSGMILEKHREDCKTALRRDIEKTLREIDKAFLNGWIKDADRIKMASAVQRIELGMDGTLRFGEKDLLLAEIMEQIGQKKSAEIENVKAALDVAVGDETAYRRVLAVLEKGDLLTANEYISLLQDGKAIPDVVEKRDDYKEFFLDKFYEIEGYLKSTNGRQLTKQVAARDQAIPVDMKPVPGAQSKQAAEMLKAWYKLKDNKSLDKDSAITVLTNLGFTVIAATSPKLANQKKWYKMEVTCEPISDMKQCPVAVYGSRARGAYKILAVWDRPSAEELLNAIGDTYHGAPIIVFDFGRIPQQRRRDLARFCRERRRTLIVIDDLLMLFLCGERGSRLPVMFKCALPFTYLEPYTTTSSLVPPEMFYGRQKELIQIMAMDGNSCGFIYGGRQLGKTALLREAERRFHHLEQGILVLWIDLRAEGIGYNRNIEEIWYLIAKELSRFGVVNEKGMGTVQADAVAEQIMSWLETDGQRRIILLFDEADRFLEIDGMGIEGTSSRSKNTFMMCSKLKGVMEKTKKRFKVVFAGLHNVQRTIRNENDPLAHYGEAICIGPLLNQGEWKEAKALVEEPFACLGYYFESPDLVTRILSQTNYYPSLIQLYCSHLHRHLTKADVLSTFAPHKCPPYIITTKHVDDVYRSLDLQNSIKHRFMLTLGLDTRYEVLAYVIAYGSLDNDPRAVDGFPVSWIREQAMYWWSAGFPGGREDTFRVLLDEMVGLGVLRLAGDGRYALRSPNVLSLMGTEEQIENKILELRESPAEYEPASFRSAYRMADGHISVRSPLTAQQEFDLHNKDGVSVVIGSTASGLGEVEPYLTYLYAGALKVVNNVSSLKKFRAVLSGLTDESEIKLLYIPAEVNWTKDWVTAAQIVESRIKIVFAADPDHCWKLLKSDMRAIDDLADKGVHLYHLIPWRDAALRQWLIDCAFGEIGFSDREQISEVTGCWASVLYRFYKEHQHNLHSWKHDLEEFSKRLIQQKTEVLHELGITRDDVSKVLESLAVLGNVTGNELTELLARDVTAKNVKVILKWADLLSLVSPGKGQWHVHPFVGRLLTAAGE